MKLISVMITALFLVGCIPATQYPDTADNTVARHVSHENPVAEDSGMPPVIAMIPRL